MPPISLRQSDDTFYSYYDDLDSYYDEPPFSGSPPGASTQSDRKRRRSTFQNPSPRGHHNRRISTQKMKKKKKRKNFLLRRKPVKMPMKKLSYSPSNCPKTSEIHGMTQQSTNFAEPRLHHPKKFIIIIIIKVLVFPPK